MLEKCTGSGDAVGWPGLPSEGLHHELRETPHTWALHPARAKDHHLSHSPQPQCAPTSRDSTDPSPLQNHSHLLHRMR